MGVITAESLMSLEQYAKTRKEFRAKVLAHKKNRSLQLGAHISRKGTGVATNHPSTRTRLRPRRSDKRPAA